MAIIELFSKRQKVLRGEVPDVYKYDQIPQALKAQIVHIWLDSLGNRGQYWDGKVADTYQLIVNTLCREYGIFRLPGAKEYGDRAFIDELVNFFLNEKSTERSIDVIELSFKVINRITRDWHYLRRQDASKIATDSIDELNSRFKEHGIGYQFTDGEIIRIDSELIHSEVVKPALKLLHAKEYSGAQEEFLKAHQHYRHGNSKEALNECLKSFESVMKAICIKRKWPFPENSTSKTLIQICLDQNLIPSFWQQHYGSLRSLLESSIPTGRNRLGGHGQGSEVVNVPNHLVAYMLHMTASAIVFMIEAEANL